MSAQGWSSIKVTTQLRTLENSWEHRKTFKMIPSWEQLRTHHRWFRSVWRGFQQSDRKVVVGSGCYLRPDQFLDHLTVIIILLNILNSIEWILFWMNIPDFVLNLILNWIILKPDSIFKTDRLPLVHYDRTWVMFHNLNANALCSKSNGSYVIKDFGTLSLIFSTSKYSRQIFQPCPSFLHPNIPDKWKNGPFELGSDEEEGKSES